MKNPVEIFVETLDTAEQKPYVELMRKQFAGVSFLYVKLQAPSSQQDFENFLHKEAERFITGTSWFYEFEYIRSSQAGLIYRFRFRVPEEKSFCCGNECPNCILKQR
ncbi:hypothetical protein [Lihuaxuella thermophila]|uniref:Uncharacterized protein n=1 Tax=Lihuaxuella thermophila TaxID=1173111 RepID=A0A1H8AM08_9BACL|nr:hypothetical protein [Lihuaxuella thermophila]SEM71546.1 hypothetical protein SAMN05444955_101225 [Lihuaxuella thermophila]